MLNVHKKELVVAAMLFFAVTIAAIELEPSLREADRLYQNGRYAEAADKALQIYNFFPGDLQTLLILGMSDFHVGNYLKAKNWFRKAQQKSPRHPIVDRYTGLLREIEYRHGPLSQDPDPKSEADPYAGAVFFKRGFFGPGFTVTSGSVQETYATATLALPTPHPPTDLGSSESVVAGIAGQALADQDFNKAFLFFSQLLAAQPGNRGYLTGKASAAFHMKRYREVIEIIGPILASPNVQGFTAIEKELADKLLQQSRQEVFSGK